MSAQMSKRARQFRKQLAFAKSQGGWARAARGVAGCTTPAKRRFDSRESAEREGKGKRAYKCPCGSWHLTTKGRAITSTEAAP